MQGGRARRASPDEAPLGTDSIVGTRHEDGRDGAPVSFAGLWERWEKGAEPIESFTILTTVASPALDAIHHRQPSILEAGEFDEWLAPGTPTERLLALARHSHERPFETRRVSRRVNSSRNEGPDLLLPLEA